MRIAREEIFGPVVCAMPFKDLPDAIAKGNDTPYGLAAGVWTRDLRKAHQAAAALDAGTVWVNCYNAFDNASPWGGFKQSGWGREKGPYGLDLFTQIKSVIVNYLVIHVTTTLRAREKARKKYVSEFLVDTGATDSLAPAKELKRVGSIRADQ